MIVQLALQFAYAGGLEIDEVLNSGVTVSERVLDRMKGIAHDPLPFDLGAVPGWADLHVHQFSFRGFDGRLVWGENEGPEDEALAPCKGWLHSNHGIALPLAPLLPEQRDLFNHQLSGKRGYDDNPDRSFEDWPVWYSFNHQQHHEDALYEAHRAGLMLMVMSAVSNRVLCLAAHDDGDHTEIGNCSDLTNIGRQIVAAHQFDEDNDWYQIALTPTDASHIMAEGKLAVVLSIESSELLDSYDRGGMMSSATTADDVLDEWGALGVRSFQPVHQWDNLVGGAALHSNFLQVASMLAPLLPLDGDLGNVVATLPAVGLLSLVDLFFASDLAGGMDIDPVTQENKLGLTDFGREFIRELEEQRMILDISHLSRRAVADALEELDPQFPFIASHARYDEMETTTNVSGPRKELELTRTILEVIRDRGGMVGLRTGPNRVDTFEVAFDDGTIGPLVENNCHGSSRSFAQSYLYGEIAIGVSQALGSDMNGMINQTRPRFHDPDAKWDAAWWACGQDVSRAIRKEHQAAQTNPTGSDFDLIGLGHIGLEGEFLYDLARIGADPAPFYSSASDFVAMWGAIGEYVQDDPDTSEDEEDIDVGFKPSLDLADLPTIGKPGCSTGVDCFLEESIQDDLFIDVLEDIRGPLVDQNFRATGIDPFEDSIERIDAALQEVAEQVLGVEVELDPLRGIVPLETRLDRYRVLNDLGTVNLDGDPSTEDTVVVWDGTFNRDASMNLDRDPATTERLTAPWSGRYNRDGSIDLDGNAATADFRLTRADLN